MYLLSEIFILSLLAILFWRFTRISSTPAPLPPGPPADPIIGHVRIVPSSRPELSFQKWGKEYKSDIIYLNFMGQPAVILNSAQAAVDLMDKRSAIYSDRPDFNFFEESGWRDVLTFAKAADPVFRKHRKLFQSAFSPTSIIQYRDKQENLARALVKQIIQNPPQWRPLLTRFASSLVLSIAYGIRITDENDSYVVLADKIASYFANGGSPGSTMVDIAPLIRHLPSWVRIFPSLNFARDNYSIVREFIEAPFASVKTRMAAGIPEVSFTHKMLEEKQSEPSDNQSDVTEDDIKGAASTMYAAGADTTLASLIIFVLCMVLNPEEQEKARKELDHVVGRDRLPNLADRGTIPCIDRLVYETARWHPVVQLGVPHKSTKDDVYKNMFIPKGSLVMANAHAITHDPSIYSEPNKFNPDRYILASEGGLGEPLPVGHFGFGRRVCPGQYLGTASVWISIATTLATLKISKAVDENGHEITPAPEMTTGLESHPEEFPCVIKPRDERAVRLVESLK
ncbi:cytochrome P450, partial [Stipitochalara longipes BDJ]